MNYIGKLTFNSCWKGFTRELCTEIMFYVYILYSPSRDKH